MLLILATIATVAIIAWLATPLLKEWPKGTRLLAFASFWVAGIAFAVGGGEHGSRALRVVGFFVVLLIAGSLREAAEKRRDRLRGAE
jgi:hypothetical protein